MEQDRARVGCGRIAIALPRIARVRVRRDLPREFEAEVDEERRTLVLRRGRATLRADFANLTVELEA